VHGLLRTLHDYGLVEHDPASEAMLPMHATALRFPVTSAHSAGHPPESPRERVGQVLEASLPLGDHVEAHREAARLMVDREPRRSCPAHAARLLGVHQLERITEAIARPGLDFAEDDRRAAPGDNVDLVARDPAVRVENSVAVQPVPAHRTALGSISRRRRGARARPR
jgi:hypothetical protein